MPFGYPSGVTVRVMFLPLLFLVKLNAIHATLLARIHCGAHPPHLHFARTLLVGPAVAPVSRV